MRVGFTKHEQANLLNGCFLIAISNSFGLVQWLICVRWSLRVGFDFH